MAVNGGVGDGAQAGSAGSVSVITAGSVSAYGGRGRGERGVRYRVIKGWVSGQQWIYFH